MIRLFAIPFVLMAVGASAAEIEVTVPIRLKLNLPEPLADLIARQQADVQLLQQLQLVELELTKLRLMAIGQMQGTAMPATPSAGIGPKWSAKAPSVSAPAKPVILAPVVTAAPCCSGAVCPVPIPQLAPAIPEPAAAAPDPGPTITPGLRLLCIIDGGADSRAMLPVLYALGQERSIAIADARRPDARPFLAVFKVRHYPHFVLYRDHEALQESWGRYTLGNLYWWFSHGDAMPAEYVQTFYPSRSQDFLGPEDRVALHQNMRLGWCGMVCSAHGGGLVLEYATDPKRAPEAHTIPNRPAAAGCPSCGRRG